MGSWTKTIHVKDCGNSWCDMDIGCRGYEVTADYSTVTDIGSIRERRYRFDKATGTNKLEEGDGSMIIGGDGIFSAIFQLLKDNPHWGLGKS